jgi:hypothetical protein|tara:strand:+ start:145 stop:546 length:402 start_codon:yes stop_codon:yes gene_type:complete
MAYEQSGSGIIITLTAAADLSAKQYNLVKLDGNGDVVLTDADSAGQIPIGVLQNAPGNGEAATVMIVGVTKIEIGEAMDEGALIAPSDAGEASDDGQAVLADASDVVCGQTIQAGSADEYITAVVNCASPTIF